MIFFTIPVLDEDSDKSSRNEDSDKSSRTKFFGSYIMMLSFCCPINLMLNCSISIILKIIILTTFQMATMVTLSKRLSFSIFCSSRIALAHQTVHVKMTLTILLISIGVKQLIDCPILPKVCLFSMSVLGVKQVVS